MNFRGFLIGAGLVALLCSTASAGLPEGIRKDLAPIAAVVLLDRGDEILLDLTAEKGGRVGDLFTVVSKGNVIKHPQTGEELGTLDEVTGLLQIVQLRPGFSIARRIEGAPLQLGAKVRRFERIAARFVDSSITGEKLFIDLRDALPHLEWQKYARTDTVDIAGLREIGQSSSGLHFLYDGQILEIRDQEYALLHRYEGVVSEGQDQVVVHSAATKVSQPVIVSSPMAAGTRPSLTAKWLGAGAKGLPIGVAVADFDADGQIEIARAFEDRLEVGRLVSGEFERLFSSSLANETTAIALTAVDLNKNGHAELFLTTVKEDDVRAEVFEYTDGQYRKTAQNQSWFLNSILLPGKGPVLLGQKRDRSHYGFSSEVYELEWKNQMLSPNATLSLPENGMIYSLAAMPTAGKDRFARVNTDGRIEIFSPNDDALWISDEKGYSETGFLQADNQNPHWDVEFLHRVFLPSALIAGPDDTVITAMNTGRTGSDKYRQMRSLTLSGWQWQNQELKPLWQMAEMDGYVPAMTVADADNDGQDELVLLIAHPNNNFFGTRKSVIKLFELN
jgi:hypothetical protein